MMKTDADVKNQIKSSRHVWLQYRQAPGIHQQIFVTYNGCWPKTIFNWETTANNRTKKIKRCKWGWIVYTMQRKGKILKKKTGT